MDCKSQLQGINYTLKAFNFYNLSLWGVLLQCTVAVVLFTGTCLVYEYYYDWYLAISRSHIGFATTIYAMYYMLLLLNLDYLKYLILTNYSIFTLVVTTTQIGSVQQYCLCQEDVSFK